MFCFDMKGSDRLDNVKIRVQDLLLQRFFLYSISDEFCSLCVSHVGFVSTYAHMECNSVIRNQVPLMGGAQ